MELNPESSGRLILGSVDRQKFGIPNGMARKIRNNGFL
jgi:hypothetical protein